MSGPGPSGPGPGTPSGGGGSAALHPADARRFAGRVDDLERTVAEAREALRRLAEDPLATGTGQDNAEMAAWYRELLVTDTVPAADDLSRQLDAVRRAVVEGAAAWEESERSITDSLGPGDRAPVIAGTTIERVTMYASPVHGRDRRAPRDRPTGRVPIVDAGPTLGQDGEAVTTNDNDGLVVLAVDDEEPALMELAYLLEQDQRVTTVLKANDSISALRILTGGDR